MDLATLQFIIRMDRDNHALLKKMTNIETRLAKFAAELVATKEALAAALANDAADRDAIKAANDAANAAREAVNAAAVKIVELQGLADADVAQDAALTAILDALEMATSAPEPAPEPEVTEPEPEAPAELEAPTSEPEVTEG